MVFEKNAIYIVATPIGNLEDITFRAIDVLKNTDFIIAEDTRNSHKLLKHYNIETKTISCHSYSSKSKMESIIKRIIENGENASLISDAGTPLISDPGITLLNMALEKNIKIIPIPGPNAFITLLSVSGMPTSEVLFVGFLSSKKGKRRNKLEKLYKEAKFIIALYESVHRIEAMLEDIKDIFGEDTKIVLGREITKKFEEILRGNVVNILDNFKSNNKILKGEFTLIIDNRV